jgi:hypothetical protein
MAITINFLVHWIGIILILNIFFRLRARLRDGTKKPLLKQLTASLKSLTTLFSGRKQHD